MPKSSTLGWVGDTMKMLGWLDIAMHHALGMRVGQRIGHAANDQRGLLGCGTRAVFAHLAQVAALSNSIAM